MEIQVKNLQKKVRINRPRIKKIVQTILHHERVKQAALSVVFVTHQKIRSLNIKYLDRDYATDVLAFDALGQTESRRASTTIISSMNGDIIISTDAAIKNARQFETCSRYELVLYIVHGILHLLGYDDHGKKNTQRIRLKEDEIMKYLKEKKLA